MRTLIPAEVGSALLYGYLGFSIPWSSAFSVMQGLYFATAVIAAVVIAAGAWRRARWVPKSAILLAAWCGIPTFATLAGFIRGWHQGSAVILSFTIVVATTFCQLIALLVALACLRLRDDPA